MGEERRQRLACSGNPACAERHPNTFPMHVRVFASLFTVRIVVQTATQCFMNNIVTYCIYHALHVQGQSSDFKSTLFRFVPWIAHESGHMRREGGFLTSDESTRMHEDTTIDSARLRELIIS